MSMPPRERGKQQARAERSFVLRKILLPVQEYIHTESTGGMVLLVAAAIALAWANSPWSGAYQQFIHTKLTLDLKIYTFRETLQHWINDGLMVLFFFVVGLEIKREVMRGKLAGLNRAAFPTMAALGGMVLPAAIYATLNAQDSVALQGWGIPMATDIAFALGVLALLGNRIPYSLRVLLLGVAIVDDVGAILVIALFYTQELSWLALGVAGGLYAVILGMRWAGVLNLAIYTLVGVCFWAAVQASGVHATLAGVLLGMAVPTAPWYSQNTFRTNAEALLGQYVKAWDEGKKERASMVLGQMEELTTETEAPTDRLIRRLHPWSSYLVLPLFALANAGVEITGSLLQQAYSSMILWGIIAGLVVGKPLGILGFSWLATRVGIGQIPQGLHWRHIAGIGMLAGIGFTVSLFISDLAFRGPQAGDQAISKAKLGILVASVLAGVVGLLFLLWNTSEKEGDQESQEVEERELGE